MIKNLSTLFLYTSCYMSVAFFMFNSIYGIFLKLFKN